MSKITERIPRSLGKVLTWRIIVSIQYFLIGYYTTGSFLFGVGLVGVTAVVNSTLYFLHERIWNRVDWDRKIKEEV
jgi:uncharacterized membrane protein